MPEYDLVQESVATKPKERAETRDEGHDAPSLAKAIEHGRADTLGAKGAMHLQRAAGNAAMGSLVQRQEEESPVHKVVGSGGGSSLDGGVRSKMEASLGYDFGGVRVHTGPDASKAATSVQAQAFTVGNDVVFNEGKYNPSSAEGQRTIAHELTHVVQQSQGSVPGESRGNGVKVSDPGDWAEQQAEATADAVMSGGHHAGDGHDHGSAGGGGAVQTLQDPTIQRVAADAGEQEAGEKDDEDSAQTLHDPTIQREQEQDETDGSE